MAAPPSSVLAGPNAGGTLIVHASETVVYTDDNDGYCGAAMLERCEDAVVVASSDSTTITVFHVLAAFPLDGSPRLAGVTFGINYESDGLLLVDFGHCGDYVVDDDDWPEPVSGTAVSWALPRTEHLVEVYWFAGQARVPTSFDLIPHPLQGGVFVDDAIPEGNMDPIADYGRLGFGMEGYLPCPDGPVPTHERSWGGVKAVFR